MRARRVTFLALAAAALLGGCGSQVPGAKPPAAPAPSTSPSAQEPTTEPTATTSAGPAPAPSATRTSAPRPPGTGTACAAVKIVAARGTGEPAGTGFLLGQVARQIDTRVSRPVTIAGLAYPATSNFTASAQQGVTELRRVVAAEAPGTCLVLLGYSQGAIVVGDTLAALAGSDAAKVRAVVMFGDPRFNSAEPYNSGSFAPDSRGVFPRRAGQLAAFNARILNICNGGDTVCQGAGASGSGSHLDYGRFAGPAADFAAARV